MTKSIRLWPLCFLFACFGIAFAAEPCAPIDGMEPLLKPGRILLLGELHGTQESPAFVLDVACHAAHSDLPLIVGLELRSNLQSGVDAFLDSKGSEEDRSALLSGQWQLVRCAPLRTVPVRDSLRSTLETPRTLWYPQWQR